MRMRIFVFPLVFMAVVCCVGPGAAHADDTVPPTVVGTIPPNGATGVGRALPIVSITFSEPMNTGSVDLASDFPVSLSWSPDHTTLYLTRTDQPTLLDQGGTYGFTLNGESQHFRDAAGNPLPRTDFSFTVGSDTTVPAVVSTNPANGATGVSRSLVQVSITFSKEMAGGVSVSSNLPVPTVNWSQDKRTVYLTRNDQQTPLASGTTYTFTLNPAAAGHLNFYDLQYCYLPQTTFSFTTAVDLNAPVVVSTSPADGATGVSRDLAQISITFSKAMAGGYSINSNFPAYTVSWSQDKKTASLTRNDLQTRLPAGMTYSFVLNGGGTTSFRDTDGNPLTETRFSFTTVEDYDYELTKVPAAPSKGFEWPYYLSIPKAPLSKRTVLLVEPNNTGTWSDDQAVHDAAALSLVRWRSDFAVKLDVPLLVPTFPRPINPPAPEPGGIYTQALDRYSLLTDAVVNGGSIKRIDLQLTAMIRDAQERLAARGFRVDTKVFMMGFSASGAFTSRFTMLHPEIVRAAAPGSPGGWPLAPVSEWWNGTTLRYPVGIADVQSLTGQPVDLAGVKRVPQYIYVGDQDTNDALDTRGFPQDETDVICANLNCGSYPYLFNRWPISEKMYESAGISNQFVIYPGVVHTITAEMFEDILQFFKRHKPVKAMPWIPLLLSN
jgi:Bacterial Ig-like domain